MLVGGVLKVSYRMQKSKFILLFVIVLLVGATSACSTLTSLASKDNTGVVIARRAQIRSSTAVVAADLLEVVRGDQLTILDTESAENNERWLRVRASDVNQTEGWIEARNVLSQELLEKTRALAAEDRDIPTQASGQLRASTNLRLTPDRNSDDNILFKLESGAIFDIVSWKRVPKPKSKETTESDDAPKAGTGQQSQPRRRNRNNRADRSNSEDQPEAPEESDELWYKVRFASSVSPAPAGWVYGKQVELMVPSDIIFYRTGREFVAWRRLDDETGEAARVSGKDKDAGKDARPGSWVILEKSSTPIQNDQNQSSGADFDRIFVLGYDKDRQEHYTAYRSPDVKGYLPLRVEGQGRDKIFTVAIDDGGQRREGKYKVYKDYRGILRVEDLNRVTTSKP